MLSAENKLLRDNLTDLRHDNETLRLLVLTLREQLTSARPMRRKFVGRVAAALGLLLADITGGLVVAEVEYARHPPAHIAPAVVSGKQRCDDIVSHTG